MSTKLTVAKFSFNDSLFFALPQHLIPATLMFLWDFFILFLLDKNASVLTEARALFAIPFSYFVYLLSMFRKYGNQLLDFC